MGLSDWEEAYANVQTLAMPDIDELVVAGARSVPYVLFGDMDSDEEVIAQAHGWARRILRLNALPEGWRGIDTGVIPA